MFQSPRTGDLKMDSNRIISAFTVDRTNRFSQSHNKLRKTLGSLIWICMTNPTSYTHFSKEMKRETPHVWQLPILLIFSSLLHKSKKIKTLIYHSDNYFTHHIRQFIILKQCFQLQIIFSLQLSGYNPFCKTSSWIYTSKTVHGGSIRPFEIMNVSLLLEFPVCLMHRLANAAQLINRFSTGYIFKCAKYVKVQI